jgi:hypothetical protein
MNNTRRAADVIVERLIALRACGPNMAHRDKSMTQIDQPGWAPMTILGR